ncbi:Deoxyguanosinetriphosphate triphosphohydrolase-like protein [Sphingomonas antarctica]|uniref:deoxyguanosinetriphosphate triphosphohydrolase n=1 Tax=Sphingomonas antarctica TaxID=2040274 RepID=UPI0039EB9E7E
MRPRAPYASDPALSRGRQHLEVSGETRGPRTAFQRDRDRIIHSTGFRRLRHKTQVFIAPDGDHYRVRLTHSLEVAQIGRTIARALGLDEDLTEALCLAHDIGHPPFGHAGEDALRDALAPYGGFDHNAQTLRQVTALETPYPRWAGLNLSWETLEGLAKHNGPETQPGWALREADAAFALDLDRWPSLEAQVAAVADDIAYDNHDIDDGLRAGLLDRDEVLAQPFLADNWAEVRRRFSDIPDTRLMPELVRHQIGWMVNDVIQATRERCRDMRSADDVRGAGRLLGGFSEGTAAAERDFKAFMYARLYHHPQQRVVAESARQVIAGLAAAYLDDPARLPDDWRTRLPEETTARARHIGDFIAGMTDRYALARYAELVGPPPPMDGV